MIHHRVQGSTRWFGFALAASSDHTKTSSRPDPTRRPLSKHHARDRIVRSQVATAFTIFEPRDINFAIVVYSECMHVDRRLALTQLLGPRRATWLRKRRKQRSQRRQPRRKRSNLSTKSHKMRIVPDVCCALRSSDWSILRRKNIRTKNIQAGPLCRWLLHNGPVFR